MIKVTLTKAGWNSHTFLVESESTIQALLLKYFSGLHYVDFQFAETTCAAEEEGLPVYKFSRQAAYFIWTILTMREEGEIMGRRQQILDHVYQVPYPADEEAMTGPLACGECGFIHDPNEQPAKVKFCPACRQSGHLKPLRTVAQLKWAAGMWDAAAIGNGVAAGRRRAAAAALAAYIAAWQPAGVFNLDE